MKLILLTLFILGIQLQLQINAANTLLKSSLKTYAKNSEDDEAQDMEVSIISSMKSYLEELEDETVQNYFYDDQSFDQNDDTIVDDASIMYDIINNYDYVDIYASIPTSDAEYTFEFTDETGNTWEVDSIGNKWYYYYDGSYTYFYNATETRFYWWNSSDIITYIEDDTGLWWGIDADSNEQCYMTSTNFYLKCWDADLNLEMFTDNSSAPYQYYNSFLTLWYFDEKENLIAEDSDGNIYKNYIDGSYGYFGADGSISYVGPEGQVYQLATDGTETWEFEDYYDNVWGYDSTGAYWYTDYSGDYWYTDADGNEYYTAATTTS